MMIATVSQLLAPADRTRVRTDAHGYGTKLTRNRIGMTTISHTVLFDDGARRVVSVADVHDVPVVMHRRPWAWWAEARP